MKFLTQAQFHKSTKFLHQLNKPMLLGRNVTMLNGWLVTYEVSDLINYLPN
jgi:hypothetical protein